MTAKNSEIVKELPPHKSVTKARVTILIDETDLQKMYRISSETGIGFPSIVRKYIKAGIREDYNK
jgi:hypothetical protein